MRIKNISNKIVHIGTKTIMPDSEAVVSDEMCKSSPVKAIERIGIIAIMEAEPVEEVTEDMPVDEPKKTRGRKAKADATSEEVE